MAKETKSAWELLQPGVFSEFRVWIIPKTWARGKPYSNRRSSISSAPLALPRRVHCDPVPLLRTRLQTAFVPLGLVAIALTGWQASEVASRALERDAYDRLTAVRETKRRQIEDYLRDLRNHVLALSTDESSIAALEAFAQAWLKLRTPAADGALREFYEKVFAPSVSREISAAELLHRWLPREPRQQALQHALIAANPHPVGAKDLFLRPALRGGYAEAHARFHPTLHRYQSAFGFYDIFLIDAGGRVVYTVFKEIDLGADLSTEPWRSTGLAGVFHKAMAIEQPEEVAAEDYRPYVASHFAPAAFLASPVWRAGEKVGVLAIQISTSEVNRVVTGNRNWREEGMGATGQAYLTGMDLKLRSDLREEFEQPELFYAHLREAGAPAATLDRIRANRTGILTMEAPPGVRPLLQAGARGTSAGVGFRGVPVLRSYAPVRSDSFSWFLLTEIDQSEVRAPVDELHRRILLLALAVSAVFLLAAWWLSRSIARPVRELSQGAALLAQGDFAARVPVTGADELARLAVSFNRMAESLQRTTVSRDELDLANQQLRQKQTELEGLADRLIEAQEEERRRLGRELHDDITQRVAALAIDTGHLANQSGDPAIREPLHTMKERLAQLSREVHGLSRRLHPSTLEDLGIEAALEAEVRAFFERGGPPVDLDVSPAAANLPPDARLAFYRIVQEALRNIERHAAASEVSIRVELVDALARLSIRDDGRGFDPKSVRQGGIGLASMEERAKLAGARFQLDSTPGVGTAICVELPLTTGSGR
jgi:signal transduction histidine kinase